MNRFFCIVIGPWKFEDFHLYRWVTKRSAKNPLSIYWFDWKRVF